ncbi:MAG TPA: DUF2911 domain-containing protein [Flavisolibacter sp.]
MTKYVIGFLVIFGLSCNDEQTAAADRKPLPPSKDTNVVRPVAPNRYAAVDVSPMDMSYFPQNFPVAKMSGEGTDQPKARVTYSRPHRQGRNIFGSLVKYGEPWRLGANEATEIEFFQPVTIQNRRVEKGRYVMYCIPQQDHWTLVLNSNLFTWGLRPDRSRDVASFNVPVQNESQSTEYFTMVFEQTASGADLVIVWDTVAVRLPIQM